MRLFLSSFVSAALFSTVAMAQATPAKAPTSATTTPAASAQPITVPMDSKAMIANAMAGMLKKFDTNNDGAISKEEWLKRHEANFADRDTDRDGKLTKEELVAGAEKQIKSNIISTPVKPPEAPATKPAAAN